MWKPGKPDPDDQSAWHLRQQTRLLRCWPFSVRLYISCLSLCFLLYACLGKGFAYLGIPPLYVGEVLLLFSLMIVARSGVVGRLFTKPLGGVMLCFLLWEVTCTVPYLGEYGLDTIRDSVTWLYAAFAICVAALLLRRTGAIALLVSSYKRFGNIFVIGGTVCASLYAGMPTHLPAWPGTDVTIPNTKCTDLCIHLAGVMAFLLVGLAGNKSWWLVPGSLAFLVGFAVSRGGGVSFLVGTGFILLIYPQAKRLFWVVGFVLVLALLASLIDIQIKLEGRNRDLSSKQLISNLATVFGEKSNEGDLDDTKEWRLEWWHRIFDYTLHGPFFWTGKGYGVNLTLDDGMEKRETDFLGLRSPHNSHLTFLARSGVPGFALWMLLQMSWAGTMLRSHYRARVRGQATWAALFAWIFAYWLAFMFNAAFDVAFEGPVTGIPFWIVWGFGWGSSMVFAQAATPARLRRASSTDLLAPDYSFQPIGA